MFTLMIPRLDTPRTLGSPSPRTGPCLLVGLALALCCGCADGDKVGTCPSPKDAGIKGYGFVVDREVQNIVDFFQVHVLRATTASGSRLTCTDIPGTYRIGNASLITLASQMIKRQPKSVDPGVGQITVPSGQKVVIVVEGVALDQVKKATVVVARGCEDEEQYTQCQRATVNIDVIATSGMGCYTDADCEPGMICNKGQYFQGGYCARVGCTTDGYCPPGAACIPDGASGLCARKCTNINDCKLTGLQVAAPQDCMCRQALTSAGLAQICAPVQWNMQSACADASVGDLAVADSAGE